MVDDDDTARDFVVDVLEHSEVDLVGNGDFEREDDMSEVGLQKSKSLDEKRWMFQLRR